ncbi:MAG: flagellar motor switch protein FliM [Armatimonadetes bacterium]|nr:flagellar motor switch protein FliM [Armatimonadota bacterium]
MQEVLSQQEIDSLLAALTSGELPVEEAKRERAPAVRAYDFRRPNKFSKEHLRTLEMLHQQFARLLSSFLSGYLHVSVNVEVASVGQMIFEEFIRSLPSPSIMIIFGLKPLEGPAIFEINAQVIYPMIDLLFGGPGTSAVENREPTDIEMTVIRRLGARILENLSASWQDFYPVAPEIQAIETNPRMQQFYAPNEVVALVTFSISLNDEEKGLINLCLPYLLLEPLISQLSVRQQFVRRAGASRPEDVRRLERWLGLAHLELKVILGESEITVKELLGLQVGDVLALDDRYDQDLRLYVEDEFKFYVQAGRVGENIAVQITSLVEGEKGDD